MISAQHCVVSTSAISPPSVSAAAVLRDLPGSSSLGCQRPSVYPDQLVESRACRSRQRVVLSCEFRATTVGDWTRLRYLFLHRKQPSNGPKNRRRGCICAAASSPESLYDILGVPPTASESDIKRAYRKLALKYHPDVYKKPDAQQKFMSIKNAYQTLVDSKMRSTYDSRKGSSRSNDGFEWGPWTTKKQNQEDFYGIEDFFRDLQADFQKGAASGKPKSLWEELAEIGEEFVEFLEKELNIVDGKDQSVRAKQNVHGSDSQKQASPHNSTKKNDDNESTSNKAEKDIEDIEDMLTKLKEELGL